MMDNETRIRQHIRELIQEEFSKLEEISTTGNVAGYLTPYAFAKDGKTNTKRVKNLARMIGYKLTKRGEEEARMRDSLNEGYYDYKNDDSMKPHQKIGNAISEMNKQIKEIERNLRMNRRLKKETGTTNDKLWKRTKNQMVKLEARLTELAAKIREMRG